MLLRTIKMIGPEIHNLIRDVVDFPKKGIIFKDITTLLMNKDISDKIIDEFIFRTSHLKIDAIAGIESRGFLCGFMLANKMNVPMTKTHFLLSFIRLRNENIVGIKDLDTRSLTIYIRNHGSMNGIISSDDIEYSLLKSL